MHYFFKKSFYILVVIFLFLSTAGFLYSVIGLVIHISDWKTWIIKLLVFILLFWLFFFLNILRKQHFPVPGIDYK